MFKIVLFLFCLGFVRPAWADATSSIVPEIPWEVARETAVAEKYEGILALIMQYQEQKLGVQFDAPPPTVRFFESYQSPGPSALYRVRTKTLFLDRHYLHCPVDLLLADLHDTPEFPERHWCNFNILRHILSHEMGHYYTALVWERIGKISWLTEFMLDEGLISREERLPHFIVHEGLAEYFTQVFPLKGDWYFSRDGWNKPYSRDDIYFDWSFKRLIYRGGYSLVQPILAKRGIEPGVRWILEHELALALPDLSPALRYQAAGSGP